LVAVLSEQSFSAFRLEESGWSWHGHSLGVPLIEATRAEFLLSFGSCSFEEPMAEMETSGWLPA
jgi:hypothetical protein